MQQSDKLNTAANPLLCDVETGLCELPSDHINNPTTAAKADLKPVKVIYYTDPICSSCWGIEPQLRKLKLEYGHILEIEYRMGGLLPDWSYNSGGISSPEDVAQHWNEASLHYDMPIDGDLWLEDSLNSSYPPSIAFKAAQMQDNEKAVLFLRIMRELLFLEKKNISKWTHLETAAIRSGLDPLQLKKDFEDRAKIRFNEDLSLAKELGVRGFPSMYFINASGQSEFVYGSKPYAFYEVALLTLVPQVKKHDYNKTVEALFEQYYSLTAKEFSELSGTPRSDSEHLLNQLTSQGKLHKLTSKNGSLWKLK